LVNAMTGKQNVQKSVEVSVVFPAYNEVDYLEPAVEKTAQALTEFTRSFELIIAEDGSTDGTAERSAELAKEYPFVRHIHGEKRLGRGTALSNAFRQSSGRILVYMDVDLATNIEQLKSLVKAVEEEKFDFAVGSRLLAESKVERSRTRQISSKSYNFLVRAMLGSKLKDHQCGFKAFKREALMPLLDEVAARHWFWDTELLVRAARKGYAIKEIPVEWKSPRDTKVHLLKDSFSMAGQVVKLWWRLKRH
jgi:glycosyltransferase involved in cell wall biosynthesis